MTAGRRTTRDRIWPARLAAALGGLLALGAPPAAAQEAWRALEIKYVRDSREYATLARQVYRVAAAALPRDTGWAVVLDVDETALDNSVYQLERQAYALLFDSPSWRAWVERGEAGAVPGVTEFVAAVRRAGGRIAWISNRDESNREATRANLARHGLWKDGDRLCLEIASEPEYTKARRRAELAAGTGRCGWGAPARVALYVGDQMGDFPAEAEGLDGDEGESAFGTRFFLVPNPMYGRWTRGVTR